MASVSDFDFDKEDSVCQLEDIDPDYNFVNKEFSHSYITPEDFAGLPKIPNDISFLHINCRSLINKIKQNSRHQHTE